MDEATWLACKDPEPMLVSLRPTPSERKLILFGCGCYRLVWSSTADCFRRNIEALERYADRLITFAELQAAYEAEGWPGVPFTEYGIGNAVADAVDTRETSEDAVVVAQAALVRDLIGNPFHPVILDSSWLTPNVQALARVIYDEQRFTDMPVLGDALGEAGAELGLVAHCREPGHLHVRGCYVLDLLLGK
jgi:hypothetical protein